MIKALHSDKNLIVNILSDSFDDNKSVNYLIKQDHARKRRIRVLMEYSFDVCLMFGDVFISADKSACVLLIKPDKKKTTFKSVLTDLKFIIKCLGFTNIKKAMHREAAISKVHPPGLLYYLWFIGVASDQQHRGTGSRLLKEVIAEAEKQGRKICLETSTLKNIPWYQSFGFSVYHRFDFGYELSCMKKT